MQIRALGRMVVGGRDDLQLRDRAVIGGLVVHAGTFVTIDELGNAIWGDRPPATYRKIVQGSVVRLRRELGEDAIAVYPGFPWRHGHFFK